MKDRLRRITRRCAVPLLLIGMPLAAYAENYIVLYQQNSVPSTAAKSIAAAGGTLVASYGQIGVAIATSNSAGFAANMQQVKGVQGVAATSGFGVPVDPGLSAFDAIDTAPDSLNPIPSPGFSDSLTGLQWDMVQIHVPEAHLYNGGNPAIVVGDIDTGLDYTHPDLAANVDDANSVNCVSGAPVPGKVAATLP